MPTLGAATFSKSQLGRESKEVVPLQPVVVEDPFRTMGTGHNW
jgi:hypothetical protein